MNKTYWILIDYMYKLKGKIASLTKAAEKLKLPPITLTETGKVKFEPDTKDKKTLNKFVEVIVHGQEPIIAGWRVLASVETLYDEKGKPQNIVNVIGDADVPESVWHMAPKCDHCGTNRRRTRTIIIKNEDGELKQIGKTCLKDFIGHGDPESIVEYFALLDKYETELDELADNDFMYWGSGRDRAGFIPLDVYLPFVALSIRTYGWISGAKAEEKFEISTSESAYEMMEGSTSSVVEEHKYRPSEADKTKASEARQWVRDLDLKSLPKRDADFYRSLLSVANAEAVPLKRLGFAAFIVQAKTNYDNKIRREALWKLQVERSEWVGIVDQKIAVDVTVDKVNTVEGEYGWTSFVKCHDATYNVITIKLSGERKWGMEETEELHVEGIVLKHSTYRGLKETLIGKRAKVTVKGYLGNEHRKQKLTPVKVIRVLTDDDDLAIGGDAYHFSKYAWLCKTADGLSVICETSYPGDRLTPGKSYRVAGEVVKHIRSATNPNEKYTVMTLLDARPLKKQVTPIPQDKDVRTFLDDGMLDLYR